MSLRLGLCAEELDPRCERAPFDFALIADRTDAASDLSIAVVLAGVSDGRPALELRGLSVLIAGSFDLREFRRERVESFVSALLKEG